MRVIAKTELGSNVLDRQNEIGRPNIAEEAEERWGAFGKKTTVRNKLKNQQQGLCAYTEFNKSGAIVPSPHLNNAEKEKAKYTINLLNLNHPFLQNQRRQRIEEVVNVLDSLDNAEAMADLIELETSRIRSWADGVFSFGGSIFNTRRLNERSIG